MAQWCNPLTLKSEQSRGVGSSPGRTPPLERHDKASRTQLGLLYFCDPALGAKNRNFTYTTTRGQEHCKSGRNCPLRLYRLSAQVPCIPVVSAIVKSKNTGLQETLGHTSVNFISAYGNHSNRLPTTICSR